ncbi:MAG: DUF3847 domain-containing protein, partial [Defluviitaleaceae bacterium]|nr:DUF3847 domain-containing protein [Defluviitaleaceae bacterium]
MAKTKTEKIASVEDKIRQLENQKRQLLKKHKEDERKARTRRLVQRGAILESFIPEPADYTEEQIKTFLKKTLTTDYAKKALHSLKPPQKGENAATTPPNAQQGNATPNPANAVNAQQNAASPAPS